MAHSDSIAKLAEALAKAQGEMRGAKNDAKNPQFNSKYATLGAVWDAARNPLSANGLALVQSTGIGETGMYLETILMHISGEWVSSLYPVRPMRQVKGEGWQLSEDPQSIGSALSYARRYALSALIGIAEDDDDGNEATGNKTITMPQQKSQSVRSEAAIAEPLPSPANGKTGGSATPETKPAHTMPPKAAIKTMAFGPRMKALNDKLVAAGISKYALAGGGVNYDHAQMSAYAEKFVEITDANLDAVMAALERRATTPQPAQ